MFRLYLVCSIDFHLVQGGGHVGDQLALASHSGRFPGSLGNHPSLHLNAGGVATG